MNYLIYSSFRKSNCTESEIKNILESSERNNKVLEITGILLHSDLFFVQYLEGELSLITELYKRIKEDSRHEEVMLIQSGTIEKRQFPSWQMGFKNVDTEELLIQSKITLDDSKIFKSILEGNEKSSAKVLSTLHKFFELA